MATALINLIGDKNQNSTFDECFTEDELRSAILIGRGTFGSAYKIGEDIIKIVAFSEKTRADVCNEALIGSAMSMVPGFATVTNQSVIRGKLSLIHI